VCEIEKEELVDYSDRSVVADVVSAQGHCWRWKRGLAWREILAYRLGLEIANVATAIRSLRSVQATYSSGAVADLTDLDSSLIRLIQDYRLDEFVLRDNDAAIAAELAFSLWVRRRDAHAWNRAYVHGVPGFFDHHAAFDAEIENESLDSFLRPGDNAGYAGNWRLRPLAVGEVPTTLGERRADHRALAIHRVHSRDAFDRALRTAAVRIQNVSSDAIRASTVEAGAPESSGVAELLIHWRDELPDALARAIPILDS